MIKKLFLTSVFTISLYADIRWISFDEYKNTSTDKPVFMFMSSTTCGPCHVLKKEMDANDDFANFINENFTPVLVKQDIEPIPDSLKSIVTPTLYILDDNQKKIAPVIMGGKTPNELFDWASEGLSSYETSKENNQLWEAAQLGDQKAYLELARRFAYGDKIKKNCKLAEFMMVALAINNNIDKHTLSKLKKLYKQMKHDKICFKNKRMNNS